MFKNIFLILMIPLFMQSCLKTESCKKCNVRWYKVQCTKGIHTYTEELVPAFAVVYYDSYTSVGYNCQYVDSGNEIYTCNHTQIKFWKGEGYSCN